MSGQLIITNYLNNNKKYILTAYRQFDRIFDLDFFPSAGSDLGNIYIGLVRDIADNINAAFIEYKKDMRGYLSLDDNINFFFLNKKNTTKLCVGDYIIVQVIKEPIKTKDAVLSSEINIPGTYCACSCKNNVTESRNNIAFSKKINNSILIDEYKSLEDFKNKVINSLDSYDLSKFNIIIRTESAKALINQICDDVLIQIQCIKNILNSAENKPLYTCLYKGKPSYISLIDKIGSSVDEIITDVPVLYDEIKKYNSNNNTKLYINGKITLNTIYKINDAVNEALSKKIWLKSGGFLVIEQTEAMVVIDVNTGKFQKGKNPENTFLKINKEAASEIGRQIRLKNLSGIIIVDFIDMKEQNNIQELLSHFKDILSHDPVQTNLIDITALGLVEITRKKTKMPVSQLLIY